MERLSTIRRQRHRSTEQPSVSEGDAFAPVPFILASTSPSSNTWTYDEATRLLSAGLVESVPGGEACLTIAEPNRNLNSAIGATVVDGSGVVDTSTATTTNGEHASNLTVTLQPGQPRWLVAGVHVCCKGCDAIGTPRCVMPTGTPPLSTLGLSTGSWSSFISGFSTPSGRRRGQGGWRRVFGDRGSPGTDGAGVER